MKRIFHFKTVYSLFLIAILVLGGVHLLGPLTTRHIFLLIMMVTCVKETHSLYHNVLFNIHLVFVLIFGVCSFYHGFFDLFLHDLIAYYFTAYVCCWATYILIIKYNGINVFTNTLLVVAVVNSFVTIGQYFNNAIAFGFPMVLQVTGYEELGDVLFNNTGRETMDFALPGLFGSVCNGYFSSVVTILILKYLHSKFRLIVIPIWCLFLFSLFCVQQRTALVAGVIGSLFLIIKQFNSFKMNQKLLFIVVCICVSAYFISTIDFEEMLSDSRYKDYSLGVRETIYQNCKDYISWNPLTANIYHFNTLYRDPPHNLFFNSIIYGTLFGSFIILYVFYRLLLLALKVILKRIDNITLSYITISVAFLSYNINSLTHNASIVTGDAMFWLLATAIMTFTQTSKISHHEVRIMCN